MKQFKSGNMSDHLLIARLNDMLDISQKKGILKFSHFLNERESYLLKKHLQKCKYENYMFFGGYEGATRLMLGVFPSCAEKDSSVFPLKAVTITYRKADQLQHKDFLGALMSLNIKREVIGDIVVSEGKTVIFLSSSLIETVVNDMRKIGKVGVILTRGMVGKLLNTQKYVDIRGTVSSLRLDCVVSFVTGLSRDKASALIKEGKIFLNYEESCNVSTQIKFDDILTVRGYGKYLMTKQLKETKKGRKFINIKKYM